MVRKRTIAVVTGSRADFGLLEPVMRALAEEPGLRLRTVITGVHLVRGTHHDVTKAGFAVDARVPMQVRGKTGRSADVAALGRGVGALGRAFDLLRPDVVIVLGDRIEALAAACAAGVGGRHLAHVHGGDRAEGVADESMRHAVSKLAHLHFAATATSRRRLVRMGEDPLRVFNVGSPAITGLGDVVDADDAGLAKLGLDPARPYIVVMHHPVGGKRSQERQAMAAVLSGTAGRQRLVLAPNDDPGRQGVVDALRAAGVRPTAHLRRQAFLSTLKRADALVGNSSAGLIEAAALRTPVVNAGPRQAGREKPANVFDCEAKSASVKAALNRALGADLRRLRHPYGDGRTPQRIAQALALLDLSAVRLNKRNTY